MRRALISGVYSHGLSVRQLADIEQASEQTKVRITFSNNVKNICAYKSSSGSSNPGHV